MKHESDPRESSCRSDFGSTEFTDPSSYIAGGIFKRPRTSDAAAAAGSIQVSSLLPQQPTMVNG